VKVLDSICQQIWKTHQWPQDWKKSVFIPIPKKGNAKECSNYHTDIENKCMDTKGEKGEGDELGNWNLYIYIIDTMYKIGN